MNTAPHNAELRALYDNLNDPYWEWYIEEGSCYYSANFMALLGYESKSNTDSPSFWHQHLNPEVLIYAKQAIKNHLVDHSIAFDINIPITNKQGERKWINMTGVSCDIKDNRTIKMAGFFRDITQSKLLIDDLKKNNDYLQLAEQFSSSGHWRIDILKNQIEWSDQVYRIYGVDKADFSPSLESMTQLIISPERDKARDYLNNAIKNAQPFYLKSMIEQTCGKKVNVECKCEVETDEQGSVTGVFGIIRDITKEESNLEKLKLSALVNHTINTPIFFINENNTIVYQDLFSHNNHKNTSLFNYIDFSITEFIELKNEAKKLGKISHNSISFDNFNSVFDISVTYETDSKIYIWIVENITAKFHKEQQQIINHRLALLGNTFSSISHDFNNVLGVTLGSIEMLELKASQGEDISTYIDRVKSSIDKGKSVTERLLAFTRQPRSNVIQFDPIKEIKDNLYLFKQLVLDSVEFEFIQDDTQCLINFPHGEFINLLLNLIINANDAIQKQGLDGKIILSAHINSDERLEIHIKDSGIGIDKGKIPQIFDPFYTSKSINKGNGIGLANVYNTMYKHNGQILVEGFGELGGADFTLLFKCQILNQNVHNISSNKAKLDITDKHILILDNEYSIAEFVAQYLDNKGGKSTFISTKEALEEILDNNKHFDIFITDIILPDITGAEAVALVLAQNPHIKIYSMSGYLSLEDKDWPHPVIRKPFNTEELEQFIENN